MHNSDNKCAPSWLRTVIAPVGSGWLFAQAFPPLEYIPLALPALAIFLLSLKGLPPHRARGAGFLFGLAAYGTGLSWFWNLFGGLSLALYGLLAVYIALFAWGSAVFDRTAWHPSVKVLAIASLWTGIEFARSELLWLSFPWMTPGHALDTANSAELLAILGVHGVSFVVVVLAALIREGLKAWPAALPILALALIPAPKADFAPATIPVAALQSESGSFDWFESRTRALTTGPGLVLWPEEALPYDVVKSKHDWPKLLSLAKDIGSVIVLGTQQTGEGKAWFNTALTLDPTGKLGTHFKNHPVHFFDDGTPGTTALPILTPLGRVGTPVCFDCDHQGVVRRMTLAGAEMFAVPSMDVAAWSLKQHLQHARLMRIRAAENGRWMLVCATSGVTQIINPSGLQTAAIEPLKNGVLTGMIGKEARLTFFTRYGWLFSWATMVMGGIFILAAVRSSCLPLPHSPPHSLP